MALLAVSTQLHCCRNPSDVCSKSMLQGQPLKRSSRDHHHQHNHNLDHPDMVISATSFPSFPREQSPASALSASILVPPPSSSPHEVYQPFRPPPPVIPALENLSIDDQLQILRDRRGLWFDYAIHIPSLVRAGFTPSMIDEATGVTGVEQNKIVVASQVRSSLLAAGIDEALVSFYDIGGADLLYELRILSAEQRKAAAEFALARKMDTKEYRELARAMKDYIRRKREEGWESFSFCPGDCLAYSCYRLSTEVNSGVERESILRKGLEYAETEKAKTKLTAFLEKGEDISDQAKQASQLQVVRLSSSEDGTPSIPYVLPVVEPKVEELSAAPTMSRNGPFTIQVAEATWKTWVALPAWEPLGRAMVPVAISLPNAAFLPWKQKEEELEEPLIVIVDKHMKSIEDDVYYVVDAGESKLGLQLGSVVSKTGSRTLGRVVLALRPPSSEEDDVDAIEWD